MPGDKEKVSEKNEKKRITHYRNQSKVRLVFEKTLLTALGKLRFVARQT